MGIIHFLKSSEVIPRVGSTPARPTLYTGGLPPSTPPYMAVKEHAKCRLFH